MLHFTPIQMSAQASFKVALAIKSDGATFAREVAILPAVKMNERGNGLAAEPVVKCSSEHEARYTLKQRTLSGPWKDLLFAVLANVSHEVAPIQWHDDSRAFDPEAGPRRLTTR
jgi:hypothetical protein